MDMHLRHHKRFSFSGTATDISDVLKDPKFQTWSGVLKGIDTHNHISGDFRSGVDGVELVDDRELRLYFTLPEGKAVAILAVGEGQAICATDIPDSHPALSVLYGAVATIIRRAEKRG
jgi:hypothetical protein